MEALQLYSDIVCLSTRAIRYSEVCKTWTATDRVIQSPQSSLSFENSDNNSDCSFSDHIISNGSGVSVPLLQYHFSHLRGEYKLLGWYHDAVDSRDPIVFMVFGLSVDCNYSLCHSVICNLPQLDIN